MKNVYLHIGHAKTGTSALQQFFFHNRDWLKDNGVLYPETGIYGPGQHKLALCLLNRYGLKDFFSWEELREMEYKSPPDMLYSQLLREIRDSGLDNILLSSEYFVNIRDLTYIQRCFAPYNLNICVTLRRIDDFLESCFSERLKNGTSCSIFKFVQNFPKCFYDYRQFLQPWIKTFGESNLVLTNYDELYPDNDIYSAFLDILGLKKHPDMTYPEGSKATNKSLGSGYKEAIRRFNKIHFPEKYRNILIDSIFNFQKRKGRDYLGQGKLMSYDFRYLLFQDQLDSSQWLTDLFHRKTNSSWQVLNDVNMYENEFKGLPLRRYLYFCTWVNLLSIFRIIKFV